MSTNQRATSYLVAVMGARHGALGQCFAKTPERAEAAMAAFALDEFDEECRAQVVDTGAMVGLWIEGDPTYISGVLAERV